MILFKALNTEPGFQNQCPPFGAARHPYELGKFSTSGTPAAGASGPGGQDACGLVQGVLPLALGDAVGDDA